MRSSAFFYPSGWSHDLEPGVGKLETEYPFFGGGRGWELPELSERRELEKAKRSVSLVVGARASVRGRATPPAMLA